MASLLPAALALMGGCRQASQGQTAAKYAGPILGRTSVLIITVCSLSQNRLGTFGCEHDFTPYMDELARDGYSMQWVVTTELNTRDAIRALLTGMNSRDASLPRPAGLSGDPSGEESVALPKLFGDLGYRTIGVCPEPELSKDSSDLYCAFDRYVDAHEFQPDRKPLGADVNARFLEWLREVRPDAFFAQLVFLDCLKPYTSRLVSERKKDGTRRKGQANSDPYNLQVGYVDEQVETLVMELEAEGYDDLLIVITADHGNFVATTRSPVPRAHLANEVLLVPCIMWHRGLNPAWSRSYELATIADVYPTLVELFGLEPSDAVGRSGVSQVRRMRDEAEKPLRPQVVWAAWDRPAVVYAGAWKLVLEPSAWSSVSPSPPSAESSRRGLIVKENLELGDAQLFRYRLDATDRTNVLGRYPRQGEALVQVFRKWAEAAELVMDAESERALTITSDEAIDGDIDVVEEEAAEDEEG